MKSDDSLGRQGTEVRLGAGLLIGMRLMELGSSKDRVEAWIW